MKKICLSSLFIILFTWQLTAHATSGIYFNVLSGWANTSGFPSQSAMNAISLETKTSPPVIRGGLGYLHDFNFNPNYGFGLEVGYGWYSQSTYLYANGTEDLTQSTTTEYLAVFMRHFKKIDVFTKIGGTRNTTSLDLTSGKFNKTENLLQVGGGVSYHFTKYIAFTTGYAHVFSNDSPITTSTQGPIWKAPSLDEVLVGIRFNFG